MNTLETLKIKEYFPALNVPELYPAAHWLIKQITTYQEYSTNFTDVELTEKSLTMIEGKIAHTNDVIQAMQDIVPDVIQITGGDNSLYTTALAIALLHDTGRFPQALTGSFIDNSETNHSRMGVDLVHEANVTGELSLPFSTDVILELLWAISEHSKYQPVITESMLLWLCRDADKLAISRHNNEWLTSIFAPGEDISEVSTEAVEILLSGRSVPHSVIKTKTDWLISRLGFVFDLQFQRTKELYIEEGLVDDILTRLEATIQETQPKILAAIKRRMLAWKNEVLTQE